MKTIKVYQIVVNEGGNPSPWNFRTAKEANDFRSKFGVKPSKNFFTVNLKDLPNAEDFYFKGVN